MKSASEFVSEAMNMEQQLEGRGDVGGLIL
jgi:hypothetical protein